ncbi:plasmid stabilization protein [Spirabiliibacterium mucosae]|uniref:plasmid stabilization protein n=1 Tax=Spirabiliibacterium mucosae TaxID=28156 RepID=UPI001F283145|nr:plasmid stabilization protein [Spirabiliibacterium mucosae]
MAVIKATKGQPLAILNHNEPAFYCLSPQAYAYLLELAEDAELAKIVQARAGEVSYPVDLEDLLK